MERTHLRSAQGRVWASVPLPRAASMLCNEASISHEASKSWNSLEFSSRHLLDVSTPSIPEKNLMKTTFCAEDNLNLWSLDPQQHVLALVSGSRCASSGQLLSFVAKQMFYCLTGAVTTSLCCQITLMLRDTTKSQWLSMQADTCLAMPVCLTGILTVYLWVWSCRHWGRWATTQTLCNKKSTSPRLTLARSRLGSQEFPGPAPHLDSWEFWGK